MRIEDIELGEKYYHTCEGCKYSCQSVEHVNCKTKIISVGDEMVVHKREGRREISCPASQFTPIEAAEEAPVLKVGDRVKIHFLP
ncbi:MAG: hypothetical protein KKE01_07975, partial [Candidatus Omnitrophica bacterium]|nr:hypothetical protein [Candidatus Omnitrophota bacterium]